MKYKFKVGDWIDYKQIDNTVDPEEFYLRVGSRGPYKVVSIPNYAGRFQCTAGNGMFMNLPTDCAVINITSLIKEVIDEG